MSEEKNVIRGNEGMRGMDEDIASLAVTKTVVMFAYDVGSMTFHSSDNTFVY